MPPIRGIAIAGCLSRTPCARSCLLLYGTGLRISEALHLNLADFDRRQAF
jgi:integrase